jgi:DnaK suppressor protein
MKAEPKNNLGFPKNLILPIKSFLERELIRLKRREKDIKANDPFSDEARSTENSLEEDVDEQIGHLHAEAKAGFIKRQMIQLRKALTRIKIGKYGICEKCGQMIDTDRLAVKPDTTICIKCEKE